MPIRIGGMASGLDTDSLIKEMMKPYQIRIDKAKQDKQVIQWKQEIYRDILSEVNKFKSTYFELLKPDTNMLASKNYSSFKANTDNNKVATATAGPGVVVGNYNVEITQVASGAKVEGVKVDGLTKDSTIGIAGNLTINGDKIVTIANDTTIQGLCNKVSEVTSGNVTARFSELTGKLTFETKATGTTTSLSVEVDDVEIFNKLGLGNGINTTLTDNGEDTIGKITPPGSTTATPISNTKTSFSIDGITYNIAGTGTTTINVALDTQEPFDKIMKFLDSYNTMVEGIHSKIEQKKQYRYIPLTDEQKEDMSEEQIKKWEEKSKEGLIKGDSALENMLSKMRTAFFDEVEGASFSLSDLGLTTSKDTTQRGKIILDPNVVNGKNGEQRLKDALKDNGDKVFELFAKTSTTPYSVDGVGKDTRYKEVGIFQRINDILLDNTRTTRSKNGKKGILIEKAGIKGDLTEFQNPLTKQMNDKDKLIDSLQVKYTEKENRLYFQFAALEKAMNNYNSQSSWLSQQLGGA